MGRFINRFNECNGFEIADLKEWATLAFKPQEEAIRLWQELVESSPQGNAGNNCKCKEMRDLVDKSLYRNHSEECSSIHSTGESWLKTKDFPKAVRDVFDKATWPSGAEVEWMQGLSLDVAIPEDPIELPGPWHPEWWKSRYTYNDISVIGSNKKGKVAIAVEAKSGEGFGKTVAKWKDDMGQPCWCEKRISALNEHLKFDANKVPDAVPYQLLERTSAALSLAKRTGAKNAVMLVHSLSEDNDSFCDYAKLVKLMKDSEEPTADKVHYIGERDGIYLRLAWVQDNPRNPNE